MEKTEKRGRMGTKSPNRILIAKDELMKDQFEDGRWLHATRDALHTHHVWLVFTGLWCVSMSFGCLLMFHLMLEG